MEKFLKLYVSTAGLTGGYQLIPLDGITEINQESTTVVSILYQPSGSASAQAGYTIANDGSATVPALTDDSFVQSIKIEHTAIDAATHSWKDFLNDSIETALTLSWQQPVFTPGGSSYPDGAASEVATTITAITSGVKVAALQ